MNATTTDIDWVSVREHVQATLGDNIRPATYDEMMDALSAVEDDVPMGILETAVSDGVLEKHGDGLDDAYMFNRDALDTSDGDETLEELATLDDGRQYAPAMVERDQWVLRTMPSKAIKAPWKRGDLKRVRWGFHLDEEDRPETSFEEALNWAENDITMTLPHNDDEDVEEVAPSYILSKHADDPQTNITMVDFDDVRDPETGDILDEAEEIIERLDSYTEVSTSGQGVHVFVYGTLPDWYAGAYLVTSLQTEEQVCDEEPGIEIYERRRHCITTGNHLEGTPEDVQDAHETIDELAREYHPKGDDLTAEDILEGLSSSRDTGSDSSQTDGSSSSQSQYFEVRTDSYVSLSAPKYRIVGGQAQGPHPVHGSSKGSTYAEGGQNFTCRGDTWHCHRHKTGGGALNLAAADLGYLDCEHADDLSRLDDKEYARLCLEFRDTVTTLRADTVPPYRALLGLAKAQGLAGENDDRFDAGIRDTLLSMWENADPSDI